MGSARDIPTTRLNCDRPWVIVMNSEDLTTQLEQVFADYLDRYFHRRDLEAIVELLAPEMVGAGTGRDEIGYESIDAIRLFVRDIEQAPNRIDYTIHRQQVRSLSPVSGFVFAEMDLSTVLAEQSLVFRGLRMTLVLAKHGDKLLIEHFHVSLPTIAHDQDEAYPIKELEERYQVLSRLVEGRTAELEEANLRLADLSFRDGLTGLANRRHLDETLATEWARARRQGDSLAVLMIDVDFFKRYNDRYGHPAGDLCLKRIAALIAGELRGTDDVAFRFGGEEFVVILARTDMMDGVRIAERIRKAIEAAAIPHAYSAVAPYVTVSLGVSGATPESTVTRDEMILSADTALYAAKRNGRNQVWPPRGKAAASVTHIREVRR